MSFSATKRHQALTLAVKKYGYGSVIKKLVALNVFFRNKPALYKVAKADKDWVSKNFRNK